MVTERAHQVRPRAPRTGTEVGTTNTLVPTSATGVGRAIRSARALAFASSVGMW